MVLDNFGLLQADFEHKELTSLCNTECNALSDCLHMGKEGSIVGEEKLLDELLLYFGVGLKSPQVEHAAVSVVSNVEAVFII